MKKILFLLLILNSLKSNSFGQVKVYETYDDLQVGVFDKMSPDTTYVVNFWATWCVPCVKELPYFEELNAMYQDKAFKQYLVSLDDPKKIESKLLPFIQKKNILSEVILLADGKAHKWIDKVDPSWSGAIPITLIYKNGEKLFYEQDFHSVEELEEELLILFNK